MPHQVQIPINYFLSGAMTKDGVHHLSTSETTSSPESILKRSEAFRRLANRLAHISHWWWEPRIVTGREEDGDYHYAPEIEALFGYTIEQLISGPQFFQSHVLHPGDRDRHISGYQDYWNSDRLVNLQDYRIIHPRLGTRYIRTTAEKILNGEGLIVEVAGTVQDITDLRNAETAKQTSDSMVRRTHRMMRLGHWFWEPNATSFDEEAGDYHYTPEAETIFGYQSSEINLEFADFARLHVHPEDRSAYLNLYHHFWYGEKHSLRVEYRFLHPALGYIHIAEFVEKIADREGRFTQIAGTIQDVTEERQAQAALRESEIKLRRGFRMAKLVHWTYEPDHVGAFTGRYTYSADVAEIYGRSGDELGSFGDDFYQRIIHPDDRAALRSLNNLFLTEGRSSYTHDYRIIHPDGGVRHLRESAEKVYGADGHVIQILGTVQDMTDIRLREAELIEARNEALAANRSKSEFLANMSHELRTPLNAILGFSEIIRDQQFGPDTQRYADYARDIHSSGDHLLKLISDILDMSKLEAGKYELFDEPLDLMEQIESCLKMVATRAKENELTIVIDRSINVPNLKGDERAIKQILINLLSNAVKFTGPKGIVTIQPRCIESGLQIAVADTGIGIAPEKLGRLFLPFQQGDAQINQRFGGTGLGLSICKRLMEQHQGTITVKSELGKGTILTITFPPARILPPDAAASRG